MFDLLSFSFDVPQSNMKYLHAKFSWTKRKVQAVLKSLREPANRIFYKCIFPAKTNMICVTA